MLVAGQQGGVAERNRRSSFCKAVNFFFAFGLVNFGTFWAHFGKFQKNPISETDRHPPLSAISFMYSIPSTRVKVQ